MLNTRVVALFVQLALALALLVVPASAAPAAESPTGSPACVTQTASHPLGVDGGLTALSRGEIGIQAAATVASRPLGVDGGVLELLSAHRGQASFAASAGSACTRAFVFPGG